MVCGRRDWLGLATSTSRRLLRSRLLLGRACFLPGRVGKGVISANLQKKQCCAPFRSRLIGGRLGREGEREGGREGVREGGREGGTEGEGDRKRKRLKYSQRYLCSLGYCD